MNFIKKTNKRAFIPLEKTTKIVCTEYFMGSSKGLVSMSAHTVNRRNSLTGFTLMELVVVVIIVGILSGVTMTFHTRGRERAMDKQAQVILTAIRSGQRTYSLTVGAYFAPGGTSPAILNQNLYVDLVDDGNWGSYNIASTNGFTASVSRDMGGYSRTWTITANSENVTCSGNCP